MNNVTIAHLINLFIYSLYFFSRAGSGVDISSLDYIISCVMSFFIIGAGYLNARKGMSYRSVLWVFFVNVFLFILSGMFDQFGSNFNILSTGNSDTFLFTLALIVYNGYFFPFIHSLEGSGFSLVVPVLLTFFPYLGFWIGIKTVNQTKNEKKSTEI
ncbi:hypothetical protein [Chryseobacterium oryctis]|uniref:Uncharacterized protein n=1 Tax=Chryseobacterium oryctis TaxID=2952618 RepID=A0ABT3HN02_9FLAO|nr:hypothetical protein [Chryseobacterium oryctis]MCW3161134.1 hypothetical protein [Chryseobacterium oryctis]